MNLDQINQLLPKSSDAHEAISPESNKSFENIENEDVGDTDNFETANDLVIDDENGCQDEQEAELKIPLKVSKA